MPAGQVIGRIAVRVLPDTSDFKEEAKRQLERIEQQLKITIGTKVDTTGARRGVLEAVRDINRDNRATDSRKIRFYTTIATDGMRTAVEKAARELQHRANSRKVSFQVDDLKATGKVQLELDQQSADRVKQKLKDWADDISPLKVTVEPDIANGSGAALGARLQALTRPRTVPIVPELDNPAVAKVGSALAALSGARVLTNVFEDLGNVIRNLDKSVPVIGSLALAIAGLAGWGLSAASNLAALSASLAQMGLAAAAMPALFAGIGIGLGVTVMAFKDMRKVLPDVYAEFGKMHKQVSADFWHEAAQPIRDLGMTFLPHLADSASQVGKFWGSLATELNKPFKTALDPMFANLSKSIEIATGGTKNFAGIITSLGLTGSEYLPQLSQWFVDLAARFDAFLGKAAADGTLKGWIDKGIENIKALGSVLYNLGGIFAGIARAAEEAGGSSLGMLAGTLARIHRTVDSSGFQEGLVGVFKGAHEAMDAIASESGPAVSSLFSTLAQLAADVLPQVGRIIGTALGAIAAGLNQSGVMEGVRALFDGLQAAVEALAPAMAPLGAALGALMSLIGAFAAQLGPLVAAALIPLAEAFSQLAPVIEPLIGLLGGALTQILTALTPLFMMLVEAITPLIEQLVAGLAPIIPVIVAAFTTMVQAVMPVVDILLQLLTAVITPLLPVIQSLAAEFLPQIAEAFARVMEAVQPLLEALLAVVNFLMPVLAPAIEFVASLLLDSLVSAINGVADVFTGVIDTIRGVWNIFAGIFTGDWGRVWNGVKQLFSGVCNTIKGLFNVVMNVGILGVAGKALKGVKALWTTIWTGIKTFATGIWNALRGGAGVFMLGVKGFIDDGLNALKGLWQTGWTAIKSFCSKAWDGIKDGVREGVSKAVALVKELPGKAKSALGSLGSTLLNAGKELIRGFVNGIKSMFGAVKSTLGDLTSKLTDWKGPLPKDKVLLYDAGRAIIQGLIKGLESQYDNVKKSLNDLTAKIPKNASKGLKARINADRSQLLKLLAQWDTAGKRLEAARDKLDKLREEAANYAEQVAKKVIDTGDVTKVEDSSFVGITASLQTAIDQAKRFAAALDKLKKLGLNSTTFDQIASAGPEAGLAAAESIAAAGADGIKELNALQAELEKYAGKAGSTASDALYQAGIRAAEGIVKGLQAQQDAIEKQMLKIADSMVRAIKKALGIHSPSRVFAKLGGFVGRGFADGIKGEADRVAKAVDAITAKPSRSDYAGAARAVSAAVTSGLGSGAGPAVTKVLNYYAAPGSSISAEEDLFAAANRTRMVGW